MMTTGAVCCSVCKSPGADLRLIGCGCTFHAATGDDANSEVKQDEEKPEENDRLSSSRRSNSSILSSSSVTPPRRCNDEKELAAWCPFCPSSSSACRPTTEAKEQVVHYGVQILALCFDPLKQAIALRTSEALLEQESHGATSNEEGEVSTVNRDHPANKASTKKRSLEEFSSPAASNNKKKSPEELEIDAAHFVYSQGKQSAFSSTSLGDTESHRTGRWTSEEIAYADALVQAFDEGRLPLPNYTKLLPFLSDALLCRPTRLTKKRKKANLSSRTFRLKLSNYRHHTKHDHYQLLDNSAQAVVPAPSTAKTNKEGGMVVDQEPNSPSSEAPPMKESKESRSLIELQDRFIVSMTSEYDRLEYRFNLAKQWRMYFSNFCVQAKYPFLDASFYLQSLEEYDQLASTAEELIRSVRRRKMGLDSISISRSNSKQSITITAVRDVSIPLSYESLANTRTMIPPANSTFGEYFANHQPTTHEISACGGTSDVDTSTMMEEEHLDCSFLQLMSTDHDVVVGAATSMELVGTAAKTDFSNPSTPSPPPSPGLAPMNSSTSSSSFLAAIVAYLENMDLPFQHVDCWVPSFTHANAQNDATLPAIPKNGAVHLIHAGHMSRRDQGGELRSAFENFGDYSQAFSFLPGKGVVGRVYSSGERSWEFGLNNLDPDFFLRAGGAEEYGVQTAVGIPVSARGVGRIVVVLYSCRDVSQADGESMIKPLEGELSRLAPQPKWKLVVDSDEKVVVQEASPLYPLYAPQEDGPQDEGRSHSLAPIASTLRQQEQDLEEEEQSHHASKRRRQGEDKTSSLLTILGPEIVSLLGDQLSNFHEPTHYYADEKNGSSSFLFQQFMGIRLLLLRPSKRRSFAENEALEILTRSYDSYSNSMRKDQTENKGRELARLLANEWRFLAPSTCTSTTASDDDSSAGIQSLSTKNSQHSILMAER